MSDFKWGTWYPIESAEAAKPDLLDVNGRLPHVLVAYKDHTGTTPMRYLICAISLEAAIRERIWTHWMPLPPGPDDPAYSPRSTP